ncbi:MAG: caspase family protein [Acidobacteria bacterium]|nr:caspase family protein [Acidobacteriota bacterium]MBI3421811.1 caspase family protein [Acidobacteriota bacterium]
MKKLTAGVCFVTLVLGWLVLPQLSSRAQTRKPNSHALLVGINHYAQAYVPPTPGAEEDALAMRELLIKHYGFHADEIKLLLGAEATAANIVAEFRRRLIAETQPGDHIFFHYSGHGSRVPDDNGDEADGFDEVLAPYDVALQGADSFANIIRDDLIGELIGELKGRQAVLVFDSCHSGTISRAPGNAPASAAVKPRYLPAPAELSRLQTSSRAVGGGPAGYDVSDFADEINSRQLRKRDLKLVKEKLDDSTARIAVISAAQAGQLAYPVKVAGGDRGALSYLFTETQRERALSFNELRAQITTRMATYNSGKRQQTPVFEVLTPFSLDEPLFAPMPFVIPAIAFANPDSTLKVTLRNLEGKRRYQLDDEISYEVTTSAPGWLYLVVFSQEGKATCVFPTAENADDRDNYVRQGTQRLPRSKYFYAIPPLGKDIVVALLSSSKLNLGDKEELTWDEVFARLRSNKLTGYINRRGVGTKKPGQASASPASLPTSLDDTDWQAASLVIETIKKPDGKKAAVSRPARRATHAGKGGGTVQPPVLRAALKRP